MTKPKITYDKDPLGNLPDHMIPENSFRFEYKDGRFFCEELGLECAAEAEFSQIVRLPHGLAISSATPEALHTYHWVMGDVVKQLKEKGVFDEFEWQPKEEI